MNTALDVICEVRRSRGSHHRHRHHRHLHEAQVLEPMIEVRSCLRQRGVPSHLHQREARAPGQRAAIRHTTDLRSAADTFHPLRHRGWSPADGKSLLNMEPLSVRDTFLRGSGSREDGTHHQLRALSMSWSAASRENSVSSPTGCSHCGHRLQSPAGPEWYEREQCGQRARRRDAVRAA